MCKNPPLHPPKSIFTFNSSLRMDSCVLENYNFKIFSYHFSIWSKHRLKVFGKFLCTVESDAR